MVERRHPNIINEKISSGNYQKLRQINKEKSMGNLYEMLKEAKKKEILSENRYKSIRDQFDFVNNPNEDDEELDEKEISLDLSSEVK